MPASPGSHTSPVIPFSPLQPLQLQGELTPPRDFATGPASLGSSPKEGNRGVADGARPGLGVRIVGEGVAWGGQREKDRLLVSLSTSTRNTCLGGGERYPLRLRLVELPRRHRAFPASSRSFRYDKNPAYHELQPGVFLRLLPAAKFKEPLNVLLHGNCRPLWPAPDLCAHPPSSDALASEALVDCQVARQTGVPDGSRKHDQHGRSLSRPLRSRRSGVVC